MEYNSPVGRKKINTEGSSVGEVKLQTDEKTLLAFRTLGPAQQHSYFYRAINESLCAVGIEQIDFVDALVPYASPYIDATFDQGPVTLSFVGLWFGRIGAGADKAKQSPEQFIREALQNWARRPKGRAID